MNNRITYQHNHPCSIHVPSISPVVLSLFFFLPSIVSFLRRLLPFPLTSIPSVRHHPPFSLQYPLTFPPIMFSLFPQALSFPSITPSLFPPSSLPSSLPLPPLPPPHLPSTLLVSPSSFHPPSL